MLVFHVHSGSWAIVIRAKAQKNEKGDEEVGEREKDRRRIYLLRGKHPGSFLCFIHKKILLYNPVMNGDSADVSGEIEAGLGNVTALEWRH